MKTYSKAFILEKAINVFVAFLFLLLAWSFLRDWQHTGRISSLLFLVQESFIVVFYLLRAMPKEVSDRQSDWFVAILSTCFPLLMRPSGTVHDDMMLLSLAQFIGIVVAILGTLSLNRSFGIVPANRGVKREGLYRLVRHPIYAGYVVAYAAFVVQSAMIWNLVWFAGFMAVLVVRIRAEERLLARDPAYAEYMKTVRWRLLPGVF